MQELVLIPCKVVLFNTNCFSTLNKCILCVCRSVRTCILGDEEHENLRQYDRLCNFEPSYT